MLNSDSVFWLKRWLVLTMVFTMFLLWNPKAVSAKTNKDSDAAGLKSSEVWKPGISRSSTPQPQVVAEDYVVIFEVVGGWKDPVSSGGQMIVELDSGRLLVSGAGAEATKSGRTLNNIFKSDDKGKTWQKMPNSDPYKMCEHPNMFKSKSGLYMVYLTANWKGPNRRGKCLEIIRSTDGGMTWSKPSEIEATRGMAVSTGNTGVHASNGRLIYTFEIAPTNCRPKPMTKIAQAVRFSESDLDQTTQWVKVEDTSKIVRYSLAKLIEDDKVLHCRIMEVDDEKNQYLIKPENWTGHQDWRLAPKNSDGPWAFKLGATLEVAAGTLGNKRDFWIVGIDAPDDPDINLLDSSVWRLSNPVANPMYAYGKAMYEAFGLNFDYRYKDGTPMWENAGRWTGWLEGVPVRLDHQGGSGKILNLLRMTNSVTDSLSGRVLFDDSGKELVAEFERIGFDDGLGVTHCYVEYDKPSGLYWMTSNVNRNSTRDMSKIQKMVVGTGKYTYATQERSNLALFYSRNAVNWFMAGMVAYSRNWVHSYHYPHFTISGNDLLVVSRSHVESPLTEQSDPAVYGVTGRSTANSHNANAVTFHRVPDFRDLANRDFIDYIEY